jgi:lipoprotein-releasing system ATP-binding protein
MEDFTAQENVIIPMRRLGRLSDAEMRDRAAGLLSAVGLATNCGDPAAIFPGASSSASHRARFGERSARDFSGRTDRQPRYDEFRARL